MWLESDIDINAGKLDLTAGQPLRPGRGRTLRALRDVLNAGLLLQPRVLTRPRSPATSAPNRA